MLLLKNPTLPLYFLANSPTANCLIKSKLANRLGNWLATLQIENGVGFNTCPFGRESHLP